MKQLILKTSIITLVSIFLAAIMVFGVLTVFFPKSLVNISYDLGNKNLAVWYSERAFEKSKAETDLQDLLYRANEIKKYDVVIKHSPTYFDTQSFENLSNTEKNYFAGKYAISLYNVGSAHTTIFEFVDDYNGGQYFSMNPYEYMIYAFDCGESNYSVEFLNLLKSKLESILVNDGSNTLITNDIAVIDKLLLN